MKTKTINLYSFDELSDNAKQVAIDECRPTEVFWAAENRSTLNAFCDLFPVKVKNWAYGNRNSGVSFEFTQDDEYRLMSGVRLAKFIWNNYKNTIYKPKQYWICNGHKNAVGLGAKHRDSKIFIEELGCALTGYYVDNHILGPLFDFMRKPSINTNFEELIQECFDSWVKACEEDIDFQNSEEQIIETIKANEYTFTENGKLENL